MVAQLRANFRSIVGKSPTLVQQRQQHQQQISKSEAASAACCQTCFFDILNQHKVVLDREKDEHVIHVPDEPPLSG